MSLECLHFKFKQKLKSNGYEGYELKRQDKLGNKRVKLYEKEWELRNPNHFRGAKGTNWENGIKSPLFGYWKNKYGPDIINELVDITDIFPTCLELTSSSIPANSLPIDGTSLLPLLENRKKDWQSGYVYISRWWPRLGNRKSTDSVMPIDSKDKELLIFEKQPIAIRDQRDKFLMNIDSHAQVLFDIQKDPREDKNILEQHPDISEKMKKELLMWFKDIKNSEFTFTSPQFRIGYKGESNSFIWAYSPNKVTGNVKNRNHIIEGWGEPGDAVYYDLQIDTPGTHFIHVEVKGKPPSTDHFSCRMNEKVLEFNERFEAGPIDIQGGRATLILQNKKTVENEDADFHCFTKINFIRRG